MVVFKDVVENNKKVALSVLAGFEYDLELEVEDDGVIIIVVGFDYLTSEFNRLFIDTFEGINSVDYDDAYGKAGEHVSYVVGFLDEVDERLNSLLDEISNNVDYISEFNGNELEVSYMVDVSMNQEGILVGDLIDITFGL